MFVYMCLLIRLQKPVHQKLKSKRKEQGTENDIKEKYENDLELVFEMKCVILYILI